VTFVPCWTSQIDDESLSARCKRVRDALDLPVNHSDLEALAGQLQLAAVVLERLPTSLEHWRSWFDVLIPLVTAIVGESRRSGGAGWPEGQPERIFDELIERASVDSGQRPIPELADLAVEVLHVFLAELGRVADGAPAFLADQHLLVNRVLGKIREDLPWFRWFGRGRGRAVRLAEMLAQDYSLTRGAEQRSKSITQLRKLVQEVPEHYADPFIQDLLVIYRKMNLDSIESKHRRD
jgi:hypothetical protein